MSFFITPLAVTRGVSIGIIHDKQKRELVCRPVTLVYDMNTGKKSENESWKECIRQPILYTNLIQLSNRHLSSGGFFVIKHIIEDKFGKWHFIIRYFGESIYM